ncbi:MAG: glycine--tRNA ligase subunit beta [Candidatus Moduliflexus flocculans]|nr:glycine--tRNA ligase subunit beta [Candidatus Moduliflexus flocculans]
MAIAKRRTGRLSPAGKGFARSQGVDEGLLEAVRTPKGEYLGLRRASPRDPDVRGPGRGRSPRSWASLSFPKMMRWADEPVPVLPAHPRPALRLRRPAPSTTAFEGFRATDTTVGHRIAAPGPGRGRGPRVVPGRASTRRSVVVDPEARKKMIVDQIEAALAPLGAEIYPDPGLLDDLTLNVEHPLVVFGAFPEDFLKPAARGPGDGHARGPEALLRGQGRAAAAAISSASPTPPRTPRVSSGGATSGSSGPGSRTPASSGTRTARSRWQSGRPASGTSCSRRSSAATRTRPSA